TFLANKRACAFASCHPFSELGHILYLPKDDN
ncbi:MAG: hypothetical protein ACJAX7_002436, partial [Saprospiraceae bacterium]